jgi:hypothetical protein
MMMLNILPALMVKEIYRKTNVIAGTGKINARILCVMIGKVTQVV